MSKRKSQTVARVPKNVMEGMKRTMPGYSNPERFQILWDNSANKIEDWFIGKKKKSRK